MLLVNMVFFEKQARFLEEVRFDIKKQLDDTEQDNRFRTLIIRPKVVCYIKK